MSYFLDVVLPIRIERTFTYSLTEHQAAHLEQGMRVAVSFGKSKIYTAIAFRVHREPPRAYEAKPILEILDERPILSSEQLAFWQWMATYYMCTLGEVLRAAIPNGLLLETETTVHLSENDSIDDGALTDDEFLIVEALQLQGQMVVKDIMVLTGKKRVLPLLNQMVTKGIVRLKENIYEKYRPKLVKYLRLHRAYQSEEALETLLDDLKRAPKQTMAILAYFDRWSKDKKPIRLKAFEQQNAISKAVIKSLLDKSVFEQYSIQTDRVIFEENKSNADDIVLNPYQKEALGKIENSFGQDKVCLLYGVTASGKTELYIKLINQAIKSGKQVLYLLPEIALTAQLIQRLKTFFGNQVAVYHSRYSQNERVEVWQNVLHANDAAKVVLGARSALFLPFVSLGLVIVDEEHEQSFKQFDPAPRYHARDAAIYLAHIFGANCLLGSATPSLESFSNAKKGKYGLATISRRYGNVSLPEIELVDIKEARRKKRMKGHFSERLLDEMNNTVELGKQIILFQNRRGFAPILECTTCGHSAQCPNCDVSLTFHQNRNQLRCHYCGYHMHKPKTCEACGNTTLDTKGFGTEQVQEEVVELFPKLKVGRMDHDTTRGKYAYEKLITSFENREIDVLVGTQMVTKGLDFDNVGLVGIMNADTLLNFPDYRSHERSFQMLVQVAGRSGRSKERGMVLIQTYNPYHQILQQVSTYDYEAFFKEQSYERRQFKYPPFSKLIRVTLRDRDFNKLNEGAGWFAQSLRNVLKVQILGPESPVVSRIRNEYIKHLLIKMPFGNAISATKKSIKRVENSFDAISKFRSVRVTYDIDHI